MVATLNQQISKEYEVEQGRAQPWGAFVHLSGTSACRGCSTRAPLAFLLGWVGWGALVWGAYLGWCFYSVCGFTFATWHCAVCDPQAGGSCAHLPTYPGSGRGAVGCVGGGGEAVGGGGIAAAVVPSVHYTPVHMGG